MIIVCSPVFTAPISGPMLRVMSMTSASFTPPTLKSTVCEPPPPTVTASRADGSVSWSQSPSLDALKYSCVKSVSSGECSWIRLIISSSPASGSTTTK